MSTIKVPNLGDGISSATVLTILVKPGDSVQKNQTILELETDKATAPIPASQAGTVSRLLVKEGDTVSPGTAVVELAGSSDTAPASATPAPVAAAPPTVAIPSAAPIQALPQLAYTPTTASTEKATSPTVRRMVELLGIDLGRVAGSAHGGRVTLDDLRGYIATLQATAFSSPSNSVSAPSTPVSAPLPDFSKWGQIEEKPATSLRKKIAQKLTHTWQSVPHVTQFDTVDITDLMAIRKACNPAYEKKGAKLTVTVFALKAIVESLKKFPLFNASFDEAKGTLIYKSYYHIGIAVDTENGLMVPVIKNVDQKSLLELALEMNELAEKARKRQIGVEDLQGGTFTISNLGGLGAGPFTPIINGHESAILALSAGQLEPKVIDGTITPRLVMPISLSYDHRTIDGADGARFTRHFVETLSAYTKEQVTLK